MVVFAAPAISDLSLRVLSTTTLTGRIRADAGSDRRINFIVFIRIGLTRNAGEARIAGKGWADDPRWVSAFTGGTVVVIDQCRLQSGRNVLPWHIMWVGLHVQVDVCLERYRNETHLLHKSPLVKQFPDCPRMLDRVGKSACIHC